MSYDEKVVIEDEKKFQEYFLKEKRKATGKVYINPVSRTIELSLNREKLEQNQEEIIEQERLGPSYHSFQEDEYLKIEKRQNFSGSSKVSHLLEIYVLEILTF